MDNLIQELLEVENFSSHFGYSFDKLTYLVYMMVHAERWCIDFEMWAFMVRTDLYRTVSKERIKK